MLDRVVAIARLPAPVEDGVEFRTDTASAATIREGEVYGGIRVAMDAFVGRAAVKLRLDVSAGDPVDPPPAVLNYPALRTGHPSVPVLAYPLPVVLAEKLCTAVELGSGNTRVRDYADVWTLTREHDVAATELRIALAATSRHRGVVLRPLSDVLFAFGSDRALPYSGFRRRLGPDAERLPQDFTRVVTDVVAFADPVLSGTVVAGAMWRARESTWTP